MLLADEDEESRAQMRSELDRILGDEGGRSPSALPSSTSDDVHDDLISLLEMEQMTQSSRRDYQLPG